MESKKWHYSGPIKICAGPIVGKVDDKYLITSGTVDWEVCAIGRGVRNREVETTISSGTCHNVSEARGIVEGIMSNIKKAIEDAIDENKDK